MNILSLFDGISCGRVALERAGIKVDKYYASEIDEYAIKISNKNYPNIIKLGNINNWQQWDIDFDDIDIIIGGSPCQDLSIAKQDRKGLNGDKSVLFYKYVEVLQRVKPKYFLLENVASMSKENKDIITKILGTEPIIINSALVSAQQRRRLYWTNIPNITQPEDKHILLKDVLETIVDEPIRIPEYGYANKSRPLTAHYSNNCGGWYARISDPNPAKQQIDIIAQPIHNYDIQNSKDVKAYKVEKGLLYINDKSYRIKLADGWYIFRKLTPIECERLQTLPDNYTEGVSNTQRYKCIGNGWTVDVIAHIFSFIPKN